MNVFILLTRAVYVCLVSCRIENYTPDMSQSEVDYSIEQALNVWAKVTPLTFTRIYSGTADLMISFAPGGTVSPSINVLFCV